MANLDTELLLRDLAAAIGDASSHARALRDETAAAASQSPYERRRWVSDLSTLQQIGASDPARPYLASWVLWLLLARVTREAGAAELLAREAPSVQLATPRPEELSLREAVRRLVAATSEGERALIGGSLRQGAAAAGAAASELWMRRGEALRRAGGEALEPLLQPLPTFAALGQAAEQALASTDDLARAVLGGRGWVEALALGVGQQGDVPWPRQLTPRWLMAPFEGEARWLDVPGLTLGTLPPLCGGSSAARALARLGARWADAAASRQLPRALASLPTSLARLRTGALFASLLRSRPFLARALGLARPEVERARRQQALVTLIAFRLEAARTLTVLAALRDSRKAALTTASERLRQALCAPAPAELAMALPRLSPTSPARLLAFSLAEADADALQEAHDIDWYRNHRAVLSLRDRLDRAPTPNLTPEEADAALRRLVASLSGALA